MKTEIRPTMLQRAVDQVIEWTYGQTNIEYAMSLMQAKRTGSGAPTDHISYMFRTNRARVARLKHPLALVVEEVYLSITGIAVDTKGEFDSVIDPGDFDTTLDFEDFDVLGLVELNSDNGGFSIVAVQTFMVLKDGSEKSATTQFIFRNNQLNSLR